MKKLAALLIAAGMALSLAACSGDSGSTTAAPSTAAETMEGKTTAGSSMADETTAGEDEKMPEETTAAGASTAGGTFTVGFDQDFPPFGYVGDDGEFTGFDIEMATECAKRMGKEFVPTPIDWDAKDLELSSGTIDCIWNGFTMNGREDDYTWTSAYMDNSQVFVVKASSGITTFDDLAGKAVEVQKDSSALHALEEDEYTDLVASFGTFTEVDQYNTAFLDLESGAVDAVAIDIGVARFQIEGKEDEYLILEDTISDEQYGVGFKLGNEELRDEVQATLMDMVADGTFAEISEKWFGYDVCTLSQ